MGTSLFLVFYLLFLHFFNFGGWCIEVLHNLLRKTLKLVDLLLSLLQFVEEEDNTGGTYNHTDDQHRLTVNWNHLYL